MSSKAAGVGGFFSDANYTLLARLKTSTLLVLSRKLSLEVGHHETNSYYTSQDVCEGLASKQCGCEFVWGRGHGSMQMGGCLKVPCGQSKCKHTKEGVPWGHIALQHEVYKTMRKNTGNMVNQPLLWASGQTKDMAMPAGGNFRHGA